MAIIKWLWNLKIKIPKKITIKQVSKKKKKIKEQIIKDTEQKYSHLKDEIKNNFRIKKDANIPKIITKLVAGIITLYVANVVIDTMGEVVNDINATGGGGETMIVQAVNMTSMIIPVVGIILIGGIILEFIELR